MTPSHITENNRTPFRNTETEEEEEINTNFNFNLIPLPIIIPPTNNNRMTSYIYKPGKPPQLIDMKPSTMKKFLSNFKFFFELDSKNHEDSIKIQYLASGFTGQGDLETWYEGDDTLSDLSYEEFTEQLMARVIPRDHAFNLISQLKKLRQGSLQIKEYISAMRALQNEVGSQKVKDSMLAGFIIDGLDLELQGLVRRDPCSVGTGLSEQELGSHAITTRVAGEAVVVPLPFVFQDFVDFLQIQWDAILVRRIAIAAQMASTSRSSTNSQSHRTHSNAKPPTSEPSISKTTSARLSSLTIRERAYLMENSGCFKCRKINLPKIGVVFHGTKNCTNGFATTTVSVPSNFIPKPETTAKLASINGLPSTLATVEAQLQSFAVGEDSSAESDYESVDLSFPPLKLRVGSADQSQVVKALADTGASSSFISQRLVDALGLEKVRLRRPRHVKLAIKGVKAQDLIIEYCTVVPVALKNGLWEAGETFFKIANLESWDIILGNPFLFKHRISPILYPTPRLDRHIIETGAVQDLLARIQGPKSLGQSLPPLPEEDFPDRRIFDTELVLAHICSL